MPSRLLTASTAVAAIHLALAGAAFSSPVTGEGPPGSVDEELVRMGREIPGFGGLFYDAEGYPTVYLLNPRDRTALSSLKSLGPEVRVRQGSFQFEQLVEWRHALRPALALPGVVSLDADEARNRVVIGLDATSPEKSLNRDRLEQEILSTGVPRQAVLLIETTAAEPLTGLQSKLRPAPGGVQILFPISPPTYGVCTLGFNAFRGSTFGFVINSHCTGVMGETDGQRYLQSLPPDGTIGTEIADFPFFTGSPCPPDRRCRYSDSAFAKYDNPRLGALGKIARPSSVDPELGPLTLKPVSARFTLTGRIGSPLTGDIVHKVGRTTGWTYGTVVATCVDRGSAGTDMFLLCQSEVRGGAGPGDSGSPVFYRLPGNKAKLVGILWGGRTDSNLGLVYVFSPLENIEMELGPLRIN